MPVLTSEEASMVANLDGGTGSIGYFFRVLGDGLTLRLFFGINTVEYGFATDPGGSRYKGAGRILDIPDFDGLLNGIAETVEWSISGIPEDLTEYLKEIPNVEGADILLGYCPMDHRGQPRMRIVPEWAGTGDYVSYEIAAVKEGEQRRFKLALTTHTGNESRRTPRKSAFTQAEQQIEYPGDQFFFRSHLYNQTRLKIWQP
ncbi:hypothetical protein [Pleomorphomonas sp. PLEO]|uniref:hypothetical protein n=1 Tax=Pleomorphomonas sp. PLEO TaxID=3239306 RepID=UPI00351E8824